MSDKKVWMPNLEDWSKINAEAYKVIFQQAKDRFEAHASTSEEFAKKAQWIAFGLFTFLGALITFNPTLKIPVGLAVVLAILLLVSLTFIGIILSPKEIALRGSPPNEILPDDFDSGDCSMQEQEQKIYFSEIVRYQEKIKQIKIVIQSRSLYYKFAFGSAFLVLLVASLVMIIKVSQS